MILFHYLFTTFETKDSLVLDTLSTTPLKLQHRSSRCCDWVTTVKLVTFRESAKKAGEDPTRQEPRAFQAQSFPLEGEG